MSVPFAALIGCSSPLLERFNMIRNSYSMRRYGELVFVSVATLVCGVCLDASATTTVATWKDNAQSAYSLTWDDGRSSQIYQIEPLYAARGLHGTFYVNPGNWGWTEFVNPAGGTGFEGKTNDAGQPAGWVYFPSQGQELGSHTMYHWQTVTGNPGQFSSVTDIVNDLTTSKNIIEAATGQKVVSFAYPEYYPGTFSYMGTTYDPKTITTGGTTPLFMSARGTRSYSFASNDPSIYTNSATPDFGDLKSYQIGSSEWEPLPADVSAKLPPAYYPGDGTTPEYPGHQPTNVDFTDYVVASDIYAKLLDDTVAAGGWGIEYSHQTGGNDFFKLTVGDGYTYGDWTGINQLAYVQHLDDIVGREKKNASGSRQIWEDTVGNVTKYIKSREAASVSQSTINTWELSVAVDDSLSDADYDVPLTLNTVLPTGWLGITQVTQSGRPLSFTTMHIGLTEYVSYDAMANGQPILIFGSPDPIGTPVPEPSSFALIVLGFAAGIRRLRK
jgi:hypothetical protein